MIEQIKKDMILRTSPLTSYTIICWGFAHILVLVYVSEIVVGIPGKRMPHRLTSTLKVQGKARFTIRYSRTL